MNCIVSNTTTLIVLAKLNRFELLSNIFTQILISKEVKDEICVKNDDIKKNFENCILFLISEITDFDCFNELIRDLDKGEASAITLAIQMNFPISIDEKRGRTIARLKNLKTVGFIGILFLNIENGFIETKDAIEIFLDAKRFGFRVSENLEKAFYQKLKT